MAVRKDIQIAGESVDSYARRSRLKPCPIVERQLPLTRLAQVVTEAVSPSVEAEQRERTNQRIVRQIYRFPYFFWLMEYRRVQSWRYALGVALGMRPRHVLNAIPLSRWQRRKVGLLYLLITVAGLLIPVTLFQALRRPLYRIAKSLR